MPIPTPDEFFNKTHLYEPIDFRVSEVFDVAKLIYFNGTIDSYCLGCGREATFTGDHHLPGELNEKGLTYTKNVAKAKFIGGPTPYPNIPLDLYVTELRCARHDHHLQEYIIKIQRIVIKDEEKTIIQNTFQKIGQYPSIADLSIPGTKKYAKVLGNERLREFNKALGLVSHGVGIGAYVYLRRIFESLIHDAQTVAELEDKWDDTKIEEYTNCRVADKIKILADRLPKFLVDHPQMYSILSKGIHELSEEECLKHFEPLKVGIELILDEKLEQHEKEEKIKAAKKALSDITTEVKNG